MAKQNFHGKLKLTELQKDTLREVGTIGAGHAATALSQLVDRKILIDVPRLEIIPIEQMPEFMGGPEKLAAAVRIRVLGNITGTILYIIPRDDALLIVDMLKGEKAGKTKTIGDLEKVLLKQTGNLLAVAYLNALTRLTDLAVLPSQPSFAFDMIGAILGSVIVDESLKIEQAVVIDTDFIEVSRKIKGRLIFLPSREALNALLSLHKEKK